MTNNRTLISEKGKQIEVPFAQVDGLDIVTIGRWPKIAAVKSEEYAESDPSVNPAGLISGLKSHGLKADIFSFSQRIPDTSVRYSYPMRWDNLAAIRLTNFDNWWNPLPQATRKNVRRAERRGVIVKVSEMDRKLAEGIKSIYDETPFRQGRRFWHYGKSVETVLKENSTYPERSDCLSAYCGEELIGFIKLVYVGNAAKILQIICKNRHFDKRPANALLAKAVELCCQKGMSFFVYGKYVYGSNTDSELIEFKRRNGFEKVEFPRYYVPLTLGGAMAIKLKIHLGWRYLLPTKIEGYLLTLRSRYYARRRPAANLAAGPAEKEDLAAEGAK